MRILYHFAQASFSRRARLALAHKGLDVELRDGRVDEAHLAEARRLWPIGTIPVLVDDGRVVGDSTVISHYLDAAYPDHPRLWPHDPQAAHAALEVTSLVDASMAILVDLGTRYYVLRADPAWSTVQRERISRAQDAIEKVAARATSPHLAGDAWSVADMWTLAATLWVRSFPARAPQAPLVAQLLTLGFRMPDALLRWAEQHEKRPDVSAIYDA